MTDDKWRIQTLMKDTTYKGCTTFPFTWKNVITDFKEKCCGPMTSDWQLFLLPTLPEGYKISRPFPLHMFIQCDTIHLPSPKASTYLTWVRLLTMLLSLNSMIIYFLDLFLFLIMYVIVCGIFLVWFLLLWQNAVSQSNLEKKAFISPLQVISLHVWKSGRKLQAET